MIEEKGASESIWAKMSNVDDLKNKIRLFKENKDSYKNSLILSKLFDAEVINTEEELLSSNNED